MTAARAWLGLIIGLPPGAPASTRASSRRPLDFGSRPPLELAVERITIDRVYRPAGAPPYVDHTLPLTPEATTRLKAVDEAIARVKQILAQ